MSKHDVVPPIPPTDFIDPLTTTQQAAQHNSAEELRSLEIKPIKHKEAEERLIVFTNPWTIDLEKKPAIKKSKQDAKAEH